MQDMTSPIQPLTNAPKKFSCWIYGLATIGGCAIVLFLAITAIIIIGLFKLRNHEGIEFSNTYTDPTTGEEVTVTTTYSLNEAVEGGVTYYQLLKDAGISLSELESQDPDVLAACMFAAIGQARVLELYNGTLPTESDIDALRTCIQ